MSSTPFSRTLRSLDADGFGPSLLAIILAMFLLLLWGMWFFLAKIPLTEVSQEIEMTQSETILATYSPQAIARFQEGQEAYIRLDGLWPETISAMVMQINYDKGQVELFAEEDLYFVDGVQERVEHVEIAIENVSPATLVMRASGLFTPSPSTR